MDWYEDRGEYYDDDVVSRTDAAALCHAAGVMPEVPLVGLVEEISRSVLAEVYAANRNKMDTLADHPTAGDVLNTDGFYLRGKIVPLRKARKRYDLLVALWDSTRGCPKNPQPEADVMAAVYPRISRAKDRLDNLVQHVREDLSEAGMPLALRYDAGLLYLDPLPE